MLESLDIQNMFKDFQSMLRQTDTGEIKINLTRSSEIERKTQEGGLLQKFQPKNFTGSLKGFLSEVNLKFEEGYIIDMEMINDILN